MVTLVFFPFSSLTNTPFRPPNKVYKDVVVIMRSKLCASEKKEPVCVTLSTFRKPWLQLSHRRVIALGNLDSFCERVVELEGF
jgi:hypothetical protein